MGLDNYIPEPGMISVLSGSMTLFALNTPVIIIPWFSGNKPRQLVQEVIPMPSHDEPGVFTRSAYSALMGLLCSSGANIHKGPNSWHYPRCTVIKLSSSNIEFLKWLMRQFSIWLTWNPILNHQGSTSFRSVSRDSFYLYILRMHWYHEGLHFLPNHFEEYFDWITLAFWAMRSGQYLQDRFYIGVSRLNDAEKLRLINVLSSKLGLDSKLTMNGSRLSIRNSEVVVEHIRPFFHVSQLHRLNRKTR